MKKCLNCNEIKSLTEFAKKRDSYQANCRACHKIWYKKYYKENKNSEIQRNYTRRNLVRTFIRWLKEVPCADCEIRYPYYVMDFDHLEDKEFLVSQYAWRRGLGTERIQKELMKCQVVCSNCHRIRTYNRKLKCQNKEPKLKSQKS